MKSLSSRVTEQEEVSLNDYLITWLNEYKKDTIGKNTFELHKINIVDHIAPFCRYTTCVVKHTKN